MQKGELTEGEHRMTRNFRLYLSCSNSGRLRPSGDTSVHQNRPKVCCNFMVVL